MKATEKRIMATIIKTTVSTFLLSCLVSNLFAQPPLFTVQYPLGDTTLSIIENCYGVCSDKVVFLNLHDNERTSRIAADSFLKSHGGLLVHIENDSNRIISFPLNGMRYAVDPNRMYSAKGRLASLLLLSEQKDSAAEPAVDGFSKGILSQYISGKSLIVALHNNSDSNYSIQYYRHLQDSLPASGKVFINPEMDEDDFVLTSDLNIFSELRSKKINVIWENAEGITDDGSLSVYASKKGIPYLNIEAEHGHVGEQYNMLMALEQIIEKASATKKPPIKRKKRKTTNR